MMTYNYCYLVCILLVCICNVSHAHVVSSSSGLQPGRNELQIVRPEGIRTYFVYIPESYFNTSTPIDTPLLFAFHGHGDNCTKFLEWSGFKPLSEQYGFILVSPCGTPTVFGNAWNSGVCCMVPSSDIDDFAFTRDIVTDLQSMLNVDKQRIYVSGFSNGAFMANVLGCVAPDIFRATATVAGIVELKPGNEGGLLVCDQHFSEYNKSISILHVHGTHDWTVPWSGDAFVGFPSVATDVSRWLERLGCNSNSSINTFHNGTFMNTLYEDCPNDVQVELVQHDGGHEWPINPPQFSTPQYIWNFFQRVSGGTN